MPTGSEFPSTMSKEEHTSPSSRGHCVPIVVSAAALGACLAAAAVGTGGIANARVLTAQNFTGSVGTVYPAYTLRNNEPSLLTAREKIAGIKHYLSLNVTELAMVLKVARPTVYAWASTPAVPSARHRERLDAIYEIARYWRTLSNSSMGSLVREPLAGGMTVVDLLSREALDSNAAFAAMRTVKEHQSRSVRRLTVAQIADRAGVKLASRPRTNWRSSAELDL